MKITADKMIEIIDQSRRKADPFGVAKALGANKLLNGTIPAGCSCPFSNKCWLPCPVNGKVQDKDFSCAMAGTLDLCTKEEQEGENV